MTKLKEYLKTLSDAGFTTLPLDQAQEAYTSTQHVLAFKFKPDLDYWTYGVLLITGAMTQKSVIFPDSIGVDPEVKLGFCGQTILINQNAFSLYELLELCK